MTEQKEPSEDNALLSDHLSRGSQSGMTKYSSFNRGGRNSMPLHNYTYGKSNPKLRPGVAPGE